MANYRDLGIADAAFTADIDLTGKQYYFVMPASTAGNVTTATGTSNPGPIGILQNSPSLGQEAAVRVFGFSKLVCEIATCNLNWARWLVCASDGQGEPLATNGGSNVSARYMDATVTSGSVKAQVLISAWTTACGAAAGS